MKTDGNGPLGAAGPATAWWSVQLARGFTAPAGASRIRAAVMAIVSWDAERSEPEYRQGLRNEAWEVVVPELVFEPQA